MSRSAFGWSLPGCTQRQIDCQCEDGPCAVCALSVDDCVCPECPECGEQGNPRCYAASKNPSRSDGHGMSLSRQQVVGRQRARVARVQQTLDIEKEALENLERGGEFSQDIADNQDPWR